MTVSELQPYIALALGAVGTTLGVVNLIRDIRKSAETLEISAFPVYRFSISEPQQKFFNAEFSKLEVSTTNNPYRNMSIRSIDAIKKSIEEGNIPNLIGFEVINLSSKSIYIDSLGLANNKSKRELMGECIDAIQSIKAEMTDGSSIEIKQNGKFITFLLIDSFLVSRLVSGFCFPIIETTSRKKRIFGTSAELEYFSTWLKNKYDKTV